MHRTMESRILPVSVFIFKCGELKMIKAEQAHEHSQAGGGGKGESHKGQTQAVLRLKRH